MMERERQEYPEVGDGTTERENLPQSQIWKLVSFRLFVQDSLCKTLDYLPIPAPG